MPEHSTIDETRLIAGRECGSCNVCCVALTIRDPELQKAGGYRCRNARRDNSCAIYDTRPQACRSFYCGWRFLKWIREPLRPDRSGVLVRLHGEAPDSQGGARIGVVFTLLNGAALKADGLAESVAAAVAADLPVFVNIPGRPGYTSAQARINEVLEHAVSTKDREGVLQILRQLWATGRSGPRERIRDLPS